MVLAGGGIKATVILVFKQKREKEKGEKKEAEKEEVNIQGVL